MIGEARDPDANYPDAAQQAGGATQAPPTVAYLHGMPIMEAVEAMKAAGMSAAGMSMAEIRKYIAHQPACHRAGQPRR